MVQTIYLLVEGYEVKEQIKLGKEDLLIGVQKDAELVILENKDKNNIGLLENHIDNNFHKVKQIIDDIENHQHFSGE